MNRCVYMGLLLASIVPTALAQSAFDGTWEIDTSASPQSTTQFEYLLKGGRFRCASCDPPFEIPADGRDHAIGGDPCIETASVKVKDDHTIEEIDKRSGKTAGTLRFTVSPSGDTAVEEWTENCNAKGDVVSGKDEMARVAAGPAGSHPVSGSWKISQRLNRSENALIIRLRLTSDTFSFADPADQKYTARLDGTETPIEGDLSHAVVSVKRTAADTIEQTDKRDGKVVQVTRFVVSGDGKTLTVSIEDIGKGTTKHFTARKQSSPPASLQ
jgi:hypothetical protein